MFAERLVHFRDIGNLIRVHLDVALYAYISMWENNYCAIVCIDFFLAFNQILPSYIELQFGHLERYRKDRIY